METTITYNATASGLTGLINLSTQTGTLGTILGSAILVGLLVGAFASAHSWNTKGWLFKLVKWLLQNVGENVLYGIATTALVGGIYYIGDNLSKFGEANPRFLYDVGVFCGEAILAVAALAVLGWASKPVWDFAWSYAHGNRKVSKSR
jgi:hypothetical protein